MGFAQNLKRLRKNQDISQEELAERIQVSRQAISKCKQERSYCDMGTSVISEFYTPLY